MTRIYASIVILALVAALTFTGNYAVKTHIHTFSNALSDISAAAQEKDFAKTKAQAVTLIENFSAHKHVLEIFIKRDYIANLAVNLNGLPDYANEDNASDLQTEIDKASAQLTMMEHLFFRIL